MTSSALGFRNSLALYVAAGLAILGLLAWKGREYYPLARGARRASELHAALRPAGGWGHSVGIAATAFMLSNFLYAARKRWKSLARLGSVYAIEGKRSAPRRLSREEVACG